MKLKSIQIKGFKSFADKMHLAFSEGLTGIVGPNGCGKSNVVEAFRWVLSSDKAKSLRAQKMEEVIFSGTEKRPAQNIAEVSITLEDVQNTMDLPFEEITITRKLTRGAESQLSLNNSPIRSLDLRALFSTTGVLHSAFAFFEQGSVDRLIRLSPQERRAYFDEAAGIAHFLEKKKTSIQKLKLAQENVERAKDLQTELKKQLGYLERQKQKAEEYRSKKEAYIDSEKRFLTAKWKSVSDNYAEEKLRYQEAFKALLRYQEDEKTSYRQMRAADEKLQELAKDLSISLQEKARLGAECAHLEKEKDRLEKELMRLAEQRQSKCAILEEGEKEWQECYQQVDFAQSELEVLTRSFQEQLEGVKVLRERFAELKGERKKVALEESEKKEQLDRLQQQLQQTERISERIVVLLEEKRLQRDEKQVLFSQLQKVYRREENAPALQKNFCQIWNPLARQVISYKAICEKFVQKIQEMRGVLRKHREKRKHELFSLKGKLEVLQQQQAKFDGYHKGAKTLLKYAKEPAHSLYKKIVPFAEEVVKMQNELNIPKKAMQLFDQLLIVQTKSDLRCVLQYVKNEGISDFTLLCLDYLDLPAISSFLKQITLASSYRHKSGFYWEYLEDDNLYLTPNGLIISAGSGEGILLQRQEQIQTLLARVQVLDEEDRQEMEKDSALELIEASFSHEQFQAVNFASAVQEKERVLETSRQHGERSLKTFAEQTQQQNHALESLAQSIKELMEEQEECKTKKQAALVSIGHEKSKWLKLAEALAKKEEQTSLFESTLQEREVKLREKELAFIEAKNTLQQVKKHKNQLEERVKEVKISLSHIQGEEREKQSLLKQSLDKIPTISSALQLLAQKLAQRHQEKESLEKKMDSFRENDQQMREALQEAQKQNYTLQNSSEQLLKEKMQLESSYEEKFQQAISEQTVPDEQVIELEKSYQRAKSYFEKLEGSVNMLAIEEYERQKNRVIEIDKHLEDLLEAQKHLLQVIEELDRKSRSSFEETFSEVRKFFRKNFSLLFDGGDADLHLVGDEDVLSAGIEVVARPPGKSFRPLTMLSGGERCLTSTALLMALFSIKAAPFCVLDEIDAPLDEANVGRFLKLLKAYSDQCQFILVTHNKKTMEYCTQLYGVSMQERGVSKVVSLHLQEEQPPLVKLQTASVS